jgi:hypothetical protein
MRRVLWRVTVAIALPMLFAGVSVAQDRGDSRRIIQLEEEVVAGRIEKPDAFYILQPTNLTYEEATLQESFIPELLRTVEQEPF